MADNPDLGSFRDPHSSVFYRDDRVLRGLVGKGASEWNAVVETGLIDELVADGLLVGTEVADGDDFGLSPRGDAFDMVLEHERVPFVSYPYEWSFSMMRDAALGQLAVLSSALDHNLTLKDGTSFNMQFIGARPTFIDVGSFEPAKGPWPGYRQFCMTSLYPLLLQAHLGIDFQPLLRGTLDGLTPETVSAMFRGRRKLKRGVFRNVTLHALADRRLANNPEQMKKQLTATGFDVDVAKKVASKLSKTVEGLTVKRSTTTWSDYRQTCSYDEADTEAKEKIVRGAVSTGDAVLDLGANDGAFTRLIADDASYVVAADFDESVIDGLYLGLKRDGVTNVLPLVMNLVDPSPGLGWRNAERARFDDRGDFDVVMALALVHHLIIGANVALPSVVEWLAARQCRVVVEYVHRNDPMVKTLLSHKPKGLFDDYTLDNFASELKRHFASIEATTLPGGTRTMFVVDVS